MRNVVAHSILVQSEFCYSELTGSKNENIQVILSEIQEIDQNVHQVPQDLPQSFCFRDVRRHDGIKSVKSKTGKIIIKLYFWKPIEEIIILNLK